MKKQKLIVISADALVFEDLELLQTLPNFKKYLADGACVERVSSIYPSVTYPCHVSMATGTYPAKHGVTSNFELKLNLEHTPWTWFHSHIKTEDIFTAAKKKGLTTASVFWPVTGNHPDIDHLIAEYWTQGPNDSLCDAFARAGSNNAMLSIIEKNAHLLVERTHPMCDNFIIACSCDILRQYKPDLLMLHPANIDAYRHQYGLFNDHVEMGIRETDAWIGQIMQTVSDIGELDNTSLVLTSDHGQLNISRIMNINVEFVNQALITLNEDGKIAEWRAFCLSNGISALIYLNNSDDTDLYNRVENLLHSLSQEGSHGIERVFSKHEISELEHLDGDFSFVIEADYMTSFGMSHTGPLVSPCTNQDYRYGKATHGHLPNKGPQPTFWAKGPGFKNGTKLERGLLVDEAPTYAKLLGLELSNADGKSLDELLNIQ